MKSIRLLPVVIFATFALFVLKGVGLLTDGGYALLGTQIVSAQEDGANGAEEGMSDAARARNSAAADRASETLFAREADAPRETTQIDAVPVTQTNLGDKIAIGTSDGTDQTERAVLERLGERRTSLEIRAEELDARAALVEAAELRLGERIAGLEVLEQRINALVEEKKALDNAQFAGVVGMYETMKPTDAASIFDSLDMKVLLRVARSMNPRKMAPVLAKMETKRATDLTSMLAEIEPEPQLNADVDELPDLPQIVGK